MVLFEMVTGLPPFWSEDISQTYQRIMDVGQGRGQAPVRDTASTAYGDLVQR